MPAQMKEINNCSSYKCLWHVAFSDLLSHVSVAYLCTDTWFGFSFWSVLSPKLQVTVSRSENIPCQCTWNNMNKLPHATGVIIEMNSRGSVSPKIISHFNTIFHVPQQLCLTPSVTSGSKLGWTFHTFLWEKKKRAQRSIGYAPRRLLEETRGDARDLDTSLITFVTRVRCVDIVVWNRDVLMLWLVHCF